MTNIQIFSTEYEYIWIFEKIAIQYYNIQISEYVYKCSVFHSLKLYLKHLWADYSPKTLRDLDECYEFSHVSLDYQAEETTFSDSLHYSWG